MGMVRIGRFMVLIEVSLLFIFLTVYNIINSKIYKQFLLKIINMVVAQIIVFYRNKEWIVKVLIKFILVTKRIFGSKGFQCFHWYSWKIREFESCILRHKTPHFPFVWVLESTMNACLWVHPAREPRRSPPNIFLRTLSTFPSSQGSGNLDLVPALIMQQPSFEAELFDKKL